MEQRIGKFEMAIYFFVISYVDTTQEKSSKKLTKSFLPIISGSSGCLFPKRWEGSWFQSGVPQTIDIQGSFLSNRGKCIASDGDKFLLVNE
jgi:hypothetical protein